MKKLFEEPNIRVEIFSVEDVITASGNVSSLQEDETEMILN